MVEVGVGVGVILKKEDAVKVLVESIGNEGLESLIGKIITLFCLNYIYTGKLVGVNADCVKLEEPRIVYETGAFAEKSWKDAQALPHKYFYIARQAIESFGELK